MSDTREVIHHAVLVAVWTVAIVVGISTLMTAWGTYTKTYADLGYQRCLVAGYNTLSWVPSERCLKTDVGI